MLKDGNEDVSQDVDKMYDILVTEFPNQRKDEQVALVNSEVNRNIIQTSECETDDEEDVLDIMHTIGRKDGGKRILMNVTSNHLDNLSFQSETSVKKQKYIFQRRNATKRALGK